MIAPELPTKIYFTILDMGSGYVYNPSLDDNGGTEYIRKDALMEWLEQNRNQSQIWFDRYHETEDLSAKQVWEEVIDKLNSM